MEDIKALVDAMDYYFSTALEQTHNDLPSIYKAFGIQESGLPEQKFAEKTNSNLHLKYTKSIKELDKKSWEMCFLGKVA